MALKVSDATCKFWPLTPVMVCPPETPTVIEAVPLGLSVVPEASTFGRAVPAFILITSKYWALKVTIISAAETLLLPVSILTVTSNWLPVVVSIGVGSIARWVAATALWRISWRCLTKKTLTGTAASISKNAMIKSAFFIQPIYL